VRRYEYKKVPEGGLIFPSKLVRFLSIALDASVTHMYPPGTRRHIKAALALGATMEDHCGAQGVRGKTAVVRSSSVC
jgi:alkylhydroperoxidase/carboxymuconolactone decarboxylase family protein YurZ